MCGTSSCEREPEARAAADAARAASGGRMVEGQEEDSQEEHDVLRTYIEIYDDDSRKSHRVATLKEPNKSRSQAGQTTCGERP